MAQIKSDAPKPRYQKVSKFEFVEDDLAEDEIAEDDLLTERSPRTLERPRASKLNVEKPRRICSCSLCCCVFSVVVYLLLAWRLRVLCMSMTWPGNLMGLDWSSCSPFTYHGSGGTLLSGCRGLLAPKPGPYFGSVASAESSDANAPLVVFGGNAHGETESAALTDAFFAPQYKSPLRPHPYLEVFASSYRSYTPNTETGSPSELVVVEDAEALLDVVLATPSAMRSGGKVMLVAFSLGCAVALELAARRPDAIAGILLASPWSSLWKMALTVWAPYSYAFAPWLWAADVWDSVAHAASLPIEIPVAILSPLSDTVIRPTMHKEVYDALQTPQKWLLRTPGADHGDLPLEASQNEAQISEWLHATCSRLASGC